MDVVNNNTQQASLGVAGSSNAELVEVGAQIDDLTHRVMAAVSSPHMSPRSPGVGKLPPTPSQVHRRLLFF